MFTFHIYRIRSMVIEAFKILYKMSPNNLHDLLSFKNRYTNYSFNDLLKIDIPIILSGMKI